MEETNRRVRSGDRPRRDEGGFTLIEMMITLVILGILAAMVYPNYREYVVRAQRDIAKSAILQVMDRQEQYFSDNKTYAADATDLGFGASPFAIDRVGKVVDAGSGDRTYTIALTNVTATTFTVQATPQLRQATEDTDCGTLSVTHAGAKNATGGSPRCW